MRLKSILACIAFGASCAFTAQAQQSTPAAAPPAESEAPAHPLPRPAAVITPQPGQSKATTENPPATRHKHSPKIVGGNTPPPK